MKIVDRLYGTTTITSSVLIELIHSRPVQRLKNITQYGVPDIYNAAFIQNFTRYEHSIGTMLLLKKLNASEEEQIAGLLHDTSHTAFSHVIDWVVGSTVKQDYQDNMHRNIIFHSEIPSILKKYGYDAERIADYKHFPLLERSIPDLCADRVDYALREFPTKSISLCISAMAVRDKKIIFTKKAAGSVFAYNYLVTQECLWSNNESAVRYMFWAKILKIALKKKIIVFADFWTDDHIILNKIHDARDKQIIKLLDIMQVYKQVSYLPKSNKIVPKKFRYIDPEILLNGSLVRLSSIDEDFVQEIARAKKENDKGVPIPKILTTTS